MSSKYAVQFATVQFAPWQIAKRTLKVLQSTQRANFYQIAANCRLVCDFIITLSYGFLAGSRLNFVNRCGVYLPPGKIIPAARKHNTTDKRIIENNITRLYWLEGCNIILSSIRLSF